MIGAILGDIIGCPYEFGRGEKTKDFPLFSALSDYTDDTVMTLAVAKAFMAAGPGADDDAIRAQLISCMQDFGRRYMGRGYGGRFLSWLDSPNPQPYNSYGNGSAMRVSSVGWMFDTLEDTLHAARLSAEVTHNHPEGIKGAQATAAAIFLARTGKSKEEIRDYIEKTFGYDLQMPLALIRPAYYHMESCQDTVPQAIISFLEAESTEDAIRNAVSLGGDADTLGAIAGSIAEAYFGVPYSLSERLGVYLPQELLEILREFWDYTTVYEGPYLELCGGIPFEISPPIEE